MRQPHMSSTIDSQIQREGNRERAFGQGYQPTVVDRFGVWLSARQIRKYTGSLSGKDIGDFGCGYHAAFVRSVLPTLRSAVLVDCALAEDLRAHPKVHGIQGILPAALAGIPAASLDVVMCISVLEHL